ncbi:MFS transporter [Enhygromyxa salina]|uniref:Major facilitator superfamily transporter n=1 Tax=Enhygromyxa salina TaxID=215803 RepID=A0A2S9XLD2_9BACT|nr:MFS transporter [Enhygromyxa salina]PRP93540.1 major facilitator superfamily transporter [Enhygromyxa salina]
MQMSDAATTEGREPLWSRAFVLAWIANFMHSTGFHAYVHWPGWLEQRGAGEVMIGVLVAVMAIAAILARPVVGRVMDTRGRKLMLVVGGLLHVASPALYLLVDTVPEAGWAAVVGVRIVHGLAQAAMFSVLFTVAVDLVPADRRAQGIALFGVSGMIPMAVGGLLGDWVIVDGDYRTLFMVTGACALAGLLLTLPLPETRRGGPSRSFFAALLAPELRPLWFVGATFAMGLAAYFVFLKTYLLEAPQLGTMGMFFSTYAVSAVLLRVFFGWVPERFGLIRVLIPSLLAGAGGLALVALASSHVHLIGAAVLCGIGHGFAFPIISALVVTRAQPDERGSAIALFTAMFDLGVLLGGPSFGVAAHVAGYPATFGLAAGLVSVATLVFVVWDRRLVGAS